MITVKRSTELFFCTCQWLVSEEYEHLIIYKRQSEIPCFLPSVVFIYDKCSLKKSCFCLAMFLGILLIVFGFLSLTFCILSRYKTTLIPWYSYWMVRNRCARLVFCMKRNRHFYRSQLNIFFFQKGRLYNKIKNLKFNYSNTFLVIIYYECLLFL